MRVECNRVREENGGGYQGRRKEKEKKFCVVVVKFGLIYDHPCFYVICACIELFGEVSHFSERSGFLELCFTREKLMICRVVSFDMGERQVYRTRRTGPSTEP